MPKEYTFPQKLKLIVDHLDAVRTLDKYVNGVELKKDMQGLSNHLQEDLNDNVVRPAGWEDLYSEDGVLYSSPKSKPRWRVVKGDFIAIEIYAAWPVQEEDDIEPYVNLYVPPNWKKRSQFTAALKAPAGFKHVRQYSEGELTDESSVFKYVPYGSYVGAGGVYDYAGFFGAFREGTEALIALEEDIDGILAGLV